MEITEFRDCAEEAICASDADRICFDWLTSAAKDQNPQRRDMMLAAIEILKIGVGHL